MTTLVAERWSSQARATCCGEAPRRAATFVERPGLQRREAAEREERGERDVLGRAPVDEGVVLPVGEVVEVLHA